MPPLTLATPRLILRPFAPTDAPVVERLAGAFAVANTTLNIPHPYPPGAAARWIATHDEEYREGAAVIWAIVIHGSDEPSGAIGLAINQRHAHAELGYWLGEPYWGQGYTTEAATAVLAYGFTHLKLHRILARHFGRNPASGRVMQKIGMTYEGCQREHFLKDGVFEDSMLYGIVRAEWEKASSKKESL